MSHDSVEYAWEQLQQRLDQRFQKYFQNNSETSECMMKNPSDRHQACQRKNKDREQIN